MKYTKNKQPFVQQQYSSSPNSSFFSKPVQEQLLTVLSVLKHEVKQYDVPVKKMIAFGKKKPFVVLIATILSLRTRDEVTLKVIEKLFREHKITSPDKLLSLGKNRLEQIIKPVNYYKTKAANLLALCEILNTKYGGNVPKSMQELISLPNVGRKTANIVLTRGFGRVDGIAVDTHCHRIPNRLGLINTKTPEETEKVLMKLLPQSAWAFYSEVMGPSGQGRCKPVAPKCSKCPIWQWCRYEKKGPY
ncbi:MAG: endonuclease III [Candidatus Woesearchaeota archaeon]